MLDHAVLKYICSLTHILSAEGEKGQRCKIHLHPSGWYELNLQVWSPRVAAAYEHRCRFLGSTG
jgi:hypothetical protein